MSDAGPASAPPTSPTPPMRPEALACIGCGYALAGLDPTLVRCPECGLSLDAARRGEWLGHADTAWLDRLGRGLRQLRVACAIAIGTFVLTLGVIAVVMTLGRTVPIGDHWLGEVLAFGVMASLFGLGLAGWWNITRHEPEVPSQSVKEAERFILLGTIIAGIGAVVFTILAQLVKVAGYPEIAEIVGRIAYSALYVLGGLHIMAALRPFSRLARRVGGPRLATQCASAFWFGLLGLVVYGLGLVLGQPLSRLVVGRGAPGMSILSLPLALLDLLASLVVLYLPVIYLSMVFWLASQVSRVCRPRAPGSVPGSPQSPVSVEPPA